MTQEQKAKAYDEALKKAKSFQEKFGGDYAGYIFPELAESEDELIRKRLINLIKELAANKDAIHTEGYFVEEQDKKYIAYLEKQKEQKPVEEINIDALLTADRLASAEMTGRLKERNEILKSPDKYGLQKPAEWSEEDEKHFEALVLASERCMGKWHCCNEECGISKHLKWLKSLRPQPRVEWSKEDEEKITMCYKFLHAASVCIDYDATHKEYIEGCIQWLKSLRPQPHWKPNEEQMEALWNLMKYSVNLSAWNELQNSIESLYNDLKNIKEK